MILVEKRHGGSWVSHIPSRFKNCRYVCTATWMGLRWPMPSKCPGAPCNKQSTSFTSIEMFHTLAQNNLCEFWCGMHLTCKNTPIIPGRNGSVNRPEKVRKVSLAMTSARCKSHIIPTWHWPETHRFEFGLKAVWKTTEDKWHDMRWNGTVVLELATAHHEKIKLGTQGWSGSASPRTDSVFIGQCLSVVHCPPAGKSSRSFTSFYIYSDGSRTHAPLPRGFLRLRQMRWRWKWKENGNEMTMKMRWQLLNRNTRGERKKGKEKGKTPTPTHLAQNGQTLKGQGKRKSGRTTGQTPTRGGGGGQKRLTQPTRREPKPTSAREGPKPDLEREHAWNRGPMGN